MTLSLDYLNTVTHLYSEVTADRRKGDSALELAHYREALAYALAGCSIGRRTRANTAVWFVDPCAQNEANISKQSESDRNAIRLEAHQLEMAPHNEYNRRAPEAAE